MSAARFVQAYRVGNELGESPVWDHRADKVYWVDIRRLRLFELEPTSSALRSWPTPGLACGVALAESGLILAIDRALWAFDAGTAKFEIVRTFDEPGTNRLNELACDSEGRIWVGSMHDYARSKRGRLYRVDKYSTTVMIDGVTVPNSLAWSPDGATMYFADTEEGYIEARRFAARTGTLGTPRAFSSASIPGRPDGSAVDREGFVWSARIGVDRVVRVARTGEVVGALDLPAGCHPTALAFGGPDLRSLFVTTSRQGIPNSALTDDAGALLEFSVAVPGCRSNVSQDLGPDRAEPTQT